MEVTWNVGVNLKSELNVNKKLKENILRLFSVFTDFTAKFFFMDTFNDFQFTVF